jgi:hypothetical protein
MLLALAILFHPDILQPAAKNGHSAVQTLSPGRLEQLNRITIRIFNLDLFAARTGFRLIAEVHSLILEFSNACR